MTVTPTTLGVVAAEAARAAGELLAQRFAQRNEKPVRTKTTPTDPVSEADMAAERAIREVLAARRPGDRVLGEEGGETSGDDEAEAGLLWIVDPLDGTVNFLFGIPAWCVSVAVHDGEGALAGVVYDPLRDELFAAERGGAATLGDRPLEASARDELATALVATGFGYDPAVREAQAAVVARVLPRVRDVRRAGSAALDLAWTAAGRLDAYYERGVQQWDIAAGVLVCERAGLEVRELAARDAAPAGLLAAPAGLIEPLLALEI